VDWNPRHPWLSALSPQFVSIRVHWWLLDQNSEYRYCIYMDTAKLFTTGGSQAVRLPKDYRFNGTEVFIRKEGKAVIIEPKSKRRWPRNFFKKIRITDRGFRRPNQGSLPPARQL